MVVLPLAFSIILVLLAGVALVRASRLPASGEDSSKRRPATTLRVTAAAMIVVALGVLGFSSIYTQQVGAASVLVNWDGTVNRTHEGTGVALKAPWETRVVFDTFSQTLNYAGGSEGGPAYTGGNVQGQQITAYVLGGAAANFDVTITYNLTGTSVADVYVKYRTQERFVEQIVSKQALSIVRKVPSSYSAVDFRGAKSIEAQEEMLKKLQAGLKRYGVEVTTVALQNIKYTPEVESSLEQVQTAKAAEETAKANLAAKQVEAQQKVVEATAAADARRIEAQAEADANATIAKSLTPEVLRARWIEAIEKTGKTIVVPEGSAPLVNVPAE
ncbi:hypothetical protein I6B53_05420 [Schaalia sp. 19OD2882]|uniref:SPFH domain-containing protein n=1 Tax=Schaalia sp. 19OD2882 TaxID=2794089 RepID=UPI001C1EAB32|nr:SPFH domain-containing protein [Schaalia sp. 19OD2882]QWW20503.1 hypothetical protein I6B53_05420 [Schaalia sp. 19OD2882]